MYYLSVLVCIVIFFFFKQKTAYEMRISDWSSDVCSSDLEFSASIIAASASTAILIPPSIALIVYSILVPGIDLRALFAAGLIPGILAGVAIMVPAVQIGRAHV